MRPECCLFMKLASADKTYGKALAIMFLKKKLYTRNALYASQLGLQKRKCYSASHALVTYLNTTLNLIYILATVEFVIRIKSAFPVYIS